MSIASKLKDLAISMGAEVTTDDDSIEEILAKMKGHTGGGSVDGVQPFWANIDSVTFDELNNAMEEDRPIMVYGNDGHTSPAIEISWRDGPAPDYLRGIWIHYIGADLETSSLYLLNFVVYEDNSREYNVV